MNNDKTKPTPGPLKYVRTEAGRFDIITDYPRVEVRYLGTILKEGDARLFVAAPKLLAQLREAARVLKALDFQMREDNPNQADAVWRHAQNCFAAIAEAKGKQ